MVDVYSSPPIDTSGWDPFPVDDSVHPQEYRGDLKEVLIPENLIRMRVGMLAREISKNYAGSDRPLAICLLEGARTFFEDLTSRMSIPVDKNYWNVGSYDGTESTGTVRLGEFPLSEILGRRIVVVDDIADTRRTLKKVAEELARHNPKSLELVSLLDKPECRIEDIELDYCGFTVANKFVVGNGLDYNDRFRDLNHIGVLDERVYQGE